MIFGKANLMAVNVTSEDKGLNIFNHLHFAEDGSTCGIDGKAMIVVTPLPKKIRKHFLLESVKVGEGGASLPRKSVMDILKAMVKDTKFGGLLEQVAVTGVDESSVDLGITDGVAEKKFNVKKHRRKFVDFKEVLRKLGIGKREKKEGSERICVSRGRLMKILEVMNKTCDSVGNSDPVFIEIDREAGDIVLRAHTGKTGQVVIGVLNQYDTAEGDWLTPVKWERKLWEQE